MQGSSRSLHHGDDHRTLGSDERIASHSTQAVRVRIVKSSSLPLMLLVCLITSCGKRNSELRRNGTIDLGDGIKIEFVLVQPGSFMMGSDRDDEAPAHKVHLTRPFYLGK